MNTTANDVRNDNINDEIGTTTNIRASESTMAT
jgi:hypothetical protein